MGDTMGFTVYIQIVLYFLKITVVASSLQIP